MASPNTPSAASDKEIQRLIDEGLDAFARGDVGEALERWRRVLALRADERRARGYIEHVERKLREQGKEIR